MKKSFSLITLVFFISFFCSGCQKTSSQTWENLKTAGNYFHRSVDSLLGKKVESRLINDRDQFVGPSSGDFIPLNDEDLKTQFAASDTPVPQPLLSPGDKGCPIRGISDFKKPTGELAELLRSLHFETDDHVLRSREDLIMLQRIAGYMKKHPNLYLSIEGHCDERASAAYNMALGARRANHVRVLLIKNGIDFNRIYTISQGKEKPISLGHSPEDWKVNRRAEFKIYEK